MQQATLDGQDFYTAFQTIIRDGLKGLEGMPDAKPLESVSYPEFNGSTYLNRPVTYEDSEVSLDIVIEGANVEAVATNKRALIAALGGTGTHDLYVYSLDTVYKVRYAGGSTGQWVQTANGVGLLATIKLLNCFSEFQPETEVVIDGNDTDTILDGNT